MTSRLGRGVLGVDACPGGWVGVWLNGETCETVLGSTIASLLAELGPAREPAVIGIDIPIGLPINDVREADALARRVLKGKSSSVFNALPRAVYEAEDYATARRRCVDMTGRSTSSQAWRLGPKVLEVADWITDHPDRRVIEVHPELSFATMTGAGVSPVLEPKKTAWGAQLRRTLLADQAIAPAVIKGNYATDDLLDAAAVAWSARRASQGKADSYPSPPEALDLPAAIWA